MNCLLGNYLEETNGVPAERYRLKCDKTSRKRGVMKYKKRCSFLPERNTEIMGKQRTDMYAKMYYGNRRREKILRREGQHRLYIGYFIEFTYVLSFPVYFPYR